MSEPPTNQTTKQEIFHKAQVALEAARSEYARAKKVYDEALCDLQNATHDGGPY